MKFRLNEKIKYYEKRAADSRLKQTQRDYAKGFVSAARDTHRNFEDIKPKHLHHVERYQKDAINSAAKTAHQFGAKQGRLAAFNTIIHDKRDKA